MTMRAIQPCADSGEIQPVREDAFSLVRPVPHLPMRAPRRKATAMDHLRVRDLLRRVEAGEEEVSAFWAVVSDAKTGFSRYRGVKVRPPEHVLARKMAALLERAAPELIAAAGDKARVQLAGMGDDAVRAVKEVVTGDIDDGRVARARLDAATTILGALGIATRSSPTIATQVNVSTQVAGGVPEGA